MTAELAAPSYYVRLKPRPSKPRKGVPRTPGRYMIQGVRFEEEKGWYRIRDAAFAEVLRNLTHNDREDGVAIFDVATQAEAEAIQARERRSKTRREVADAEVQTVSPSTRRNRRGEIIPREASVTAKDTRPEAEPAMIDGADGEDDAPTDTDETDTELGKLAGGVEQELDDDDSLLDDNSREPKAPVVKQPSASPKPQARTRGATVKPKK